MPSPPHEMYLVDKMLIDVACNLPAPVPAIWHVFQVFTDVTAVKNVDSDYACLLSESGRCRCSGRKGDLSDSWCGTSDFDDSGLPLHF